ncbi:MAG TPA: type II toxin-antitoxin system VapC family toxin [Candidatus Limnocylindrales bacterium]
MAGAIPALEREAIVFDAHPFVIFLNDEPGAGLIESLLVRASNGTTRVLMTVVNAAEVLVAQERRGGAEASHRTLDVLQELPLELIDIDLELAARAAYFKARGGISLADCFAAALAHREGLPVLTGDPEFERVADDVQVIWLSGHQFDASAPPAGHRPLAIQT